MKTVTLSSSQLDSLLYKFYESVDGDGDFSVLYEDDDLMIDIKGYCIIEGYREDDYYNGTGAYVETDKYGLFEYTAYLYNKETEDSEEVLIDNNSIENINDFLNKVQN